MTIEILKSQMGDYAKDIRLNLSNVLTEEGAPDLSLIQIWSIALASAYATKQPSVIAAVKSDATATLSEAEQEAAKAAASIMGMNNVYYRFLHLSGDKEISALPAKLRMNVISNPGVPKVDFELCSLAISAINGCGMCIESHVHEVIKAGVTKLGVQSCIRIAAVINAAAQAVAIATMESSFAEATAA